MPIMAVYMVLTSVLSNSYLKHIQGCDPPNKNFNQQQSAETLHGSTLLP